MNDTSLITFRAISNFTLCLNEVFGKDNRSLKLYAHLISKTTIAHEKPILKHIEAFRTFCLNNREAIENKNVKKIKDNQIVYSERVYINMKLIFSKADQETKNIIWKHLLTISALVDPTGQAKKLLKEASEKAGVNGGEANFLNDIISKVEENVDPNANPMEAVSSIMKSGIFQDLVSNMGNGLENGSLDLGRLMGTVQQLVTNLNPDQACNNGNTNNANPAELINTMMNSMNVPQPGEIPEGNRPGAPPDIANLVGMMGPMLGALSGNNNNNNNNNHMSNVEKNSLKIEQNIKNQLEEAKSNGELNSSISKIDQSNFEKVD
tara:strand:- start:1666 stop:2631 length:966 start_codon:yes stop_codon:yes gene_type:complete